METLKYKYDEKVHHKLHLVKTTPDNAHADKDKNKQSTATDALKISALQNKLYAENRQSLLIILQGMDSSGKDGTIKKIMSAANPQGVVVHSFKHPSSLELDHDFLWRHVLKMPNRGQITIFNRSHYENVLISKVHPKLILSENLPMVKTEKDITKKFWKTRYEQIQYFEISSIENGTQILKFFLHISKEEQRKRFLQRIEKVEKHWKFSSADISERAYWDEYEHAYEEAMEHTSTEQSPWYVIPADNKHFAHALINRIILETLKKMDPTFPSVNEDEKIKMKEAKNQLLSESD